MKFKRVICMGMAAALACSNLPQVTVCAQQIQEETGKDGGEDQGQEDNPLGLQNLGVETEDVVIYDAMEFEAFRGRTKEEIGKKYGEALYAGDSYVNGVVETYFEEMCSTEAPYAPGKLTEDTHKTMTAMANFYRWLVGVKPLEGFSTHSDKLQAEALVRIFSFGHFVDDSKKPEDMSQELWELGKSCSHNILAGAVTPRDSIAMWINEGYNLSSGKWDTLGHREFIISSGVSGLQFGYAGWGWGCAIGRGETTESTIDIPFSAFPAPGYMPQNLVYGRRSAWSIEISKEKLKFPEEAKNIVVRVTKPETGESYECTQGNGKLTMDSGYTNRTVRLAFVQPEPDPVLEDYYTGRYQVEVTGLTDVDSGKAAVLTYTTEFFDPTEYTPSYVAKVSIDGIETYQLPKSAKTKENMKKMTYALPSEVTVETENGRKAQVPVKGSWILNEAEQCWTNEADAAKLPTDISDKNHLLEKCVIRYSISDSEIKTLTISPSKPKVGEPGKMTVNHLLAWPEDEKVSAVFQLTPQEDGSYICRKKFDSRTSKEFEKEQSGEYYLNHIYHISSFQESDSGEYFSIHYDFFDTWAYVSTIQTLQVQKPGNGTEDSKITCKKTVYKVAYGAKPFKINASSKSKMAFTSSSPKVAAVDKNTGRVTIKNTGTATITIKAGKASKKVTVKVSPKKPSVKSTTAVKGKKLAVKWAKDKMASGYQVQVSTDKKFKKGVKSKNLPKTSCTFTKLKTGKKYYVRIRSYKKSGKETLYSAWSKAKSSSKIKR